MAVTSGQLKAGGEERKGKAVIVLHTWKDCLWDMGSVAARKGEVPEPREILAANEGEEEKVEEVDGSEDGEDGEEDEAGQDGGAVKPEEQSIGDAAPSTEPAPESSEAPIPKSNLTADGTYLLRS